MKAIKLPTSLTRSIGRLGLQLRKHSPEILMVTGVVGVVTSAVMACKATTKVGEVMETAKEQIDHINECGENGYIQTPTEKVPYSAEDHNKDLTIIYVQTGIKLIKLYGPAVALGALSLTGMLASNNILRKRNIALAAAYTAIDTSFKDYRKRVVDRFGKELDRELKLGVKARELTETVTNEDGTTKTTTTVVEDTGKPDICEYDRIYDDGCIGWSKSPEENKKMVLLFQAQANNRLREQGHLFLNEVYDMFGFPRTAAGQIVGWLDSEEGQRDGFVDFGLTDMHDPNVRRFVNGNERNIWLRFNVDGPIYNLI